MSLAAATIDGIPVLVGRQERLDPQWSPCALSVRLDAFPYAVAAVWTACAAGHRVSAMAVQWLPERCGVGGWCGQCLEELRPLADQLAASSAFLLGGLDAVNALAAAAARELESARAHADRESQG